MNKNIYEFTNYKKYLDYVFNLKPGYGRGERTRLASFIGCNTTYISQVMNGINHFSLEQAERANRFFNHTKDESHFFILLVEYARAGTEELKKYFMGQIHQAIENRMDLKNRLEFKKKLSSEDQNFYYSFWYITAIHLLTSISKYQNINQISSYLGLNISRTQNILEELLRCGFIEKEGDLYKSGPVSIHLGSESPLIGKHHINWRMQAIQNLELGFDPQSLHFSSVVTIAKSDVRAAREILVEAIEKIRTLVKESKEDSLYCYNIDLFEVGRKSSS